MPDRDDKVDALFGAIAEEAFAKGESLPDELEGASRYPSRFWDYHSSRHGVHFVSARRPTERLEPDPTPEERLAKVEAALGELKGLIENLQVLIEEDVWTAELSVCMGLKLKRPIPIMVEESEDDVIARWVEPSLIGIGASDEEAIEGLAANIREVWEELREDSDLHPRTKRILTILEQYVEGSR